MVSGRRPSKTRGFLRFSKRPRNPLRTLGWSTFENSCFLRFSNRPRDPLRTLGRSTFENSWFFFRARGPRAGTNEQHLERWTHSCWLENTTRPSSQSIRGPKSHLVKKNPGARASKAPQACLQHVIAKAWVAASGRKMRLLIAI